jgi:predicted MFS family arabinose efflux permease
VVTLFFCAALNYGDRTSVSSVLPLLRHDFGMSDVALGAIGSFFLLSYACGSPFAGMLADRWSRSRIVVLSLLAWSVITAATGFATNTGELLAARVLLGLAECLYLPASIALIADYHSDSTRAVAMGVHISGLSFGMIVGGTLGGYIGQEFGWRTMFFVLGGAGVIAAVVCQVVLRDRPRAEPAAPVIRAPRQPGGIRSLLAVPTYRIILGEAMLASIGTWVFYNWLPLYYKETFHMSLAGAGFSGTFGIQVASVMAALLGGRASDWAAGYGLNRRMLLQCSFLFAAAPCCLPFLWPATYTAVSAAVFLYSFLQQFSGASEHPVLCDVLDPKLRATAIGCMNTTNCLTAGVGVLVAGYLKEHFGLPAIFAGAAGLTFFSGTLVWIGYRYFISRDLRRRAFVDLDSAPALADSQ